MFHVVNERSLGSSERSATDECANLQLRIELPGYQPVAGSLSVRSDAASSKSKFISCIPSPPWLSLSYRHTISIVIIVIMVVIPIIPAHVPPAHACCTRAGFRPSFTWVVVGPVVSLC